MASNLKNITYSIVIPFLLLTCYSASYSQQVSRVVNYSATYKPFGDEIRKEYAFPNDVDPDKHFQIVFTFDLTPEQIEADVTGTMIFDQENGTIQIRGRDGNLQSTGGLTLKGVVKVAFVIESIPILCDFPLTLTVLCPITVILDNLVETPLSIDGEVTFLEAGGLNLSKLLPIGSLTVNPFQTWNETEPFSTLLLNDDVVVRGGIRKLVRAELTAVEVVQLIVAALTAIPSSVSAPLGTVIEKGLGNAAISANLGFISTATLSGESITVNGVKITSESQTIEAPGLDLSQDSYTVNSSYNEKFKYKLDLAATSDVTIEFNPLGIPIWSYEKVIGEITIAPIIAEDDFDLNFTTNQTTFPITQGSTTPTVQAPVPKGAIPSQSLPEDGSGTTVDVVQYFSSSNSLTYQVSTSPSGIANASVSGSQVTITPVTAGTATVVVTASDTVTNLTAIQTIPILVYQTSAVIVRPPNNDPTFTVPNNSNPRAEGLREGVSVIIQNVPPGGPGLNLRSNPWIGDNQIRKLWNGGTGIITDGPEENDGYTWWKVDWDQVDIEAWSVDYFNDAQLLFRRPPDIEIRDFDVSKSSVSAGETLELEVRVRNNGPGESAATEVYFYYHSGSKNYDLEDLSEETDLRIPGAGKLSVPSLRERRSKTLTLDVDVPSVPDRYYYGAFLPSNVHNTDYQGDVTEADLRNNLASEQRVTVNGRSDYIIESISVSKTTLDPGESFTLRATVRNQGEGAPTSSADLDYYRSTDARISSSDSRVGDDSVSILDKDETGRESISLTAPSSPGVYYYGACVSDVRNESDTSNNCSAAVAITVQTPEPDEPTVPNLVVESPTTSAATLGPGESFTLNATVRNKGTATSSATTFRWYRSANANISMNDTEIGSANVKSLSAGGTETQQIILTVPKEVGTYYYGGCVESITDESDTADNCSSAITITVQNRAPTPVGTILSQTLSVGDSGIRLDVSPYFSDPNNTPLTYTASSSDTNVVSAEAAGVSGSNLTIHPIAEGSATITVTASDGELTGTQLFSVTVNPMPVTISESPDLVVSLTANHRNLYTLTTDSYLIDSNDYFRLIADVRNQGNEDTPGRATVRYYLSTDSVISDDDEEVATGSTQQLDAGDSDDDSEGTRAPEKPGDYYYYAYVDSIEGESNTDNNYSNVIKVSVRGPDLVITSVSVDYYSGRLTTVGPNGLFRLHATVQNHGTDEASSTTLRYYVSSDETLSDDDTEIDTDRVHSLDPDETENEQSNTTNVNYASGIFYCFVCIDEVADEIHTDNNCSDPIKITVRNVAPQAQGTITAQTLNIGTSTSFGVSDYFTDANNDTLTYTANSGDDGIVTASASGTQVTLTPKKVGSATITVTASDGTLTATQTISVSVVEPNRAPVAVGTISARTLTSGASTEEINISANFQDPDNDTLTYTVNSNNTNVATANISGSQITITPVAVGSATITVTASDGKLTAKQIISVSVVAANRAPTTIGTISAQTLIAGGSSVSVNVSDNFNDPDNDILTYAASSSATSIATVSVSGSQVTITSVGTGNTTITITASDGELTTTQTISVTVNAAPVANRAPVTVGAISSQSLTLGDSAIVINVSDNFSDPDNDTLTYSAYSDNTSAVTVSVSGSQITITPVGAGNTTITITTSDGELTAMQTISVSVVDPNRAPVTVGAISPRTLTVGNSSEQIDVSGNFNDPDNDILTYTAGSSATSIATVSVSGSQVTITPVGAGNTTITITASDGELTATQNISVIVTAAPIANRAPIAVSTISDRTLTVGDAALQIDVSAIFNDPDNDTLIYTANSNNPSVATASTSNNGQVTITPIAAGDATITVTVDDGSLTATQTISVTVTVDSPVLISISDTNLAATVRGTLGLRANDAITPVNILNLTHLNAQSKNIRNLTGLEHATNLTNLVFQQNNISDVTPLKNLTKLTYLDLHHNNISDVTPLKNLTKLTYLGLVNNDVSDITPLKNLTKLTYLGLAYNDISDITPLKNLTKLTNLTLHYNNINDLTSLKDLIELTYLYLDANDISDVTPLNNLTKLTYLYLSSNGISDVTPLNNLTKLDELRINSNGISDISALSALTNLSLLDMGYNQITVLPTGFFNNFSNLKTLGLTGNPGVPFIWTLTLARTDNSDLSTASPATVKVKLAEDAPFEMTVSLSVTGGTLSATTVTIAKGSTESSTITVTQSGTSKTTVSLGTAPTVPSGYSSGIQTAVGNSIVLFSTGPVAVGTISAQTLTVGNSAVTVDVSDNFSGADNNTLEYSVSSSNTSVATASVTDEAIVTITPVAAGSATITVTASHGTLSADQTISVTVSGVSEETWMPDANLRAAVRSTLDIQSGSALTQQAMTGLTTLIARGTSTSNQISDLSGLEYATNLTRLFLDSNPISDLTPLKGLTALTQLELYRTSTSDLTPLKGLTALKKLNLSRPDHVSYHISNLTPLKGLTGLTELSLSGNRISDLTPLKGLTALTKLDLSRNRASDLTPLKGLTALTNLYLSRNQISDITPLKDLTRLSVLNLYDNQISDITPLKDLTAHTWLYLGDNQISDITPLAGLTNLKILYLFLNQISDMSPLENLTALTDLYASRNPISDYAPLSALKAANPNLNIGEIDFNNNIPTFTEGASTTRTVAENTASGVNIGNAVSATDADDDTLTYSLSGTDAESFSIVSTSGQLQTSAALDYETKTSYSVIVIVYDGNSGGDTITVTVNVTDDPNAAPAVQANPAKTALMPNFPNPFNPETWIPYQLAKPANVTLTVYNLKGAVVRELALGHQAAGVYYTRTRAAHWDGRNKMGEKVATGLYFVKFTAGDYTATRKMLIRK